MSKYLLLCFVLLFLSPLFFGCSGSSGSAGAPGAAGTAGTAGTDATSFGTLTGTVKDLYGSNVEAVAITASPAVEGVTVSPSDASGVYTATLPNGAYTLTFTKSGYTTQTQTVTAVATQTKTLDIFLEPTGAFAVNAGADKTVDISTTATTDVALAATMSIFDPSLKAADAVIAWSVVSGAGVITGGATLAPTITLNKQADYKAVLVEKNAAVRYTGAPGDIAALNRWRVVPLTVTATRAMAQGTIKAVTLRLTVTNGGVTKTDDVVLAVALPVVPNTGLRNVPIGQPVLLQGPTQATYAWTMTGPTGSTAALNDATTRYPDFIPDLSGTYTISEAGTARITITAGKYVGMMAGYRAPDSGCGSSGACHVTFNNTTRMNTWLATGHKDVMFAGMREVPPGGHYTATCAPCHTTGVKYYTTTVNSGSFADLSTSETDADGKTLFTWFNDNHKQGSPNIESEIATRFPDTYKLAGIQCEVCHGPNLGPGHGYFSATNPLTETARVSYSSNTCGLCHGRPPSHGALQQWASSGHGNYELAEGEGVSSQTGCTGCHSAQGFFLLKAQLADGKGNRTIALSAGQAAWGAAAVEPITCIVCHDPHNEGNMMVSEEFPIRIMDNTDFLPAGFMASGVGRGAQCIFCHNSRNGGENSSAFNAVTKRYVSTFVATTLHEDLAPTWGTAVTYSMTNLTGWLPAVSGDADPAAVRAAAYTAPHAASQSDVLMGRNAYFLGAATPGERSKHSFIADTCVECHMALSKAPSTLGSASRPDHTFGNTVAEVCGDCHGGYTGEQLMTYFDDRLSVLNQEIANAIYRIKNGVNPPAGVTVSFTSGRSPAIVIGGTGILPANTSGTLHHVKTGTGTTTVPLVYDGYFDGLALTNIYGYDATIAKLNWNYELLRTGSGRATHNPAFTTKVLEASIAAAKAR